MFRGEFTHSIDSKGRVIVPAKFRDELGDNFMVTKGLDGCLYGFTWEDWKEFETKLSTLPLTNPDSRKFARFFLAGSTDVDVDKMGRILLPQNLRTFAALEKDVVVVGMAKRFEIWDKDRWEENQANNDMDEIAANIESLGIML